MLPSFIRQAARTAVPPIASAASDAASARRNSEPFFQPPAEFVASLGAPQITCTTDPKAAAENADVLYTDVWVSMGKEDESADRLAALTNYQVNDALVASANPGALVMHCLPAYRGKEITEACLENHADTIFQQAENRLHAQKAVLREIARRK